MGLRDLTILDLNKGIPVNLFLLNCCRTQSNTGNGPVRVSGICPEGVLPIDTFYDDVNTLYDAFQRGLKLSSKVIRYIHIMIRPSVIKGPPVVEFEFKI